MGIVEREATIAERMAKYGAVVETKPAFGNDFSASNTSTGLEAFQRKLVDEAFAEELSLREYFIKPEDIRTTKERVLDVCSEMFERSDDSVGPWAAARKYCKMRLEEAEATELENKKKRLLANIADNYLSKVKTHQDFSELQSLMLLDISQLTAKYENPNGSASQEVKINDEISRSLAEAAVLLVAKPKEEQEAIVKETMKEVVKETKKPAAAKTVIDIKEQNSKFYNKLIKAIKDKKTGKLNGDAFMKLTPDQQFGLLRIAGVSEDDLLKPELLTDHIKVLAEFIETAFQ